ncbi:MAG: hypothetical protein ACXACI_19425 [Candidatus Hodarchaeales archaeon]|jgi:hypothetical protein
MIDEMYNEYCCKEFAEFADRDEYENGAFVRMSEGQYSVNGCCGGGCFVVSPFCGADLWEIDQI